MRCGDAMLELTDLKITLDPANGGSVPEEAYGKVTRGWDHASGTFDLRLTSTPGSLAALLAGALGGDD